MKEPLETVFHPPGMEVARMPDESPIVSNISMIEEGICREENQ